MSQAVTVFAPLKLSAGITEEELIAGSESFQNEFVSLQPGVLRRELIRIEEGRYMDIVQFRSKEDFHAVVKAEAKSPVCQKFFSLMDFADTEESIELYPSLATWSRDGVNGTV